MRYLVKLAVILAVFGCLSLSAMPAQAQSERTVAERAEDVVAVLRGEMDYEEVFDPSFVAAVP